MAMGPKLYPGMAKLGRKTTYLLDELMMMPL